jgi:hypothetical protein
MKTAFAFLASILFSHQQFASLLTAHFHALRLTGELTAQELRAPVLLWGVCTTVILARKQETLFGQSAHRGITRKKYFAVAQTLMSIVWTCHPTKPNDTRQSSISTRTEYSVPFQAVAKKLIGSPDSLS